MHPSAHLQFDYLVREKIADGALIAKWRKPGDEILCSMLAIQKVWKVRESERPREVAALFKGVHGRCKDSRTSPEGAGSNHSLVICQFAAVRI